MKKFFIVLCFACIISLSFGLTACGRDEAKITGIHVSVVLPDDDNYSDALTNKSTVAENDYILEVGKTYQLTIECTASGGSKYPGFESIDGITLLYDSEIFEIIPPTSDGFGQTIRYDIICKRAVDFSTVLVEVDAKYCNSVIISAK